jgi:hypothetical protein
MTRQRGNYNTINATIYEKADAVMGQMAVYIFMEGYIQNDKNKKAFLPLLFHLLFD